MTTSHDHLASQKHLARYRKGVREDEELEVDRRTGRKKTSKSGQGWSSPVPRGLWRAGKDGETEERRGRQKKRWEENIKEWTGLEFAIPQRAVENRTDGESWVAKSSVAP